jgi:small subunit ribosomal protein S6
MNKYEVMFIVKTTMESDAASKLANGYKKLIADEKGNVTNFKDMGQRKLAYTINKQTNGFYYVINFDANKEVVSELDRRLGLDENIIRHLITKLDEE